MRKAIPKNRFPLLSFSHEKALGVFLFRGPFRVNPTQGGIT